AGFRGRNRQLANGAHEASGRRSSTWVHVGARALIGEPVPGRLTSDMRTEERGVKTSVPVHQRVRRQLRLYSAASGVRATGAQRNRGFLAAKVSSRRRKGA